MMKGPCSDKGMILMVIKPIICKILRCLLCRENRRKDLENKTYHKCQDLINLTLLNNINSFLIPVFMMIKVSLIARIYFKENNKKETWGTLSNTTQWCSNSSHQLLRDTWTIKITTLLYNKIINCRVKGLSWVILKLETLTKC